MVGMRETRRVSKRCGQVQVVHIAAYPHKQTSTNIKETKHVEKVIVQGGIPPLVLCYENCIDELAPL